MALKVKKERKFQFFQKFHESSEALGTFIDDVIFQKLENTHVEQQQRIFIKFPFQTFIF